MATAAAQSRQRSAGPRLETIKESCHGQVQAATPSSTTTDAGTSDASSNYSSTPYAAYAWLTIGRLLPKWLTTLRPTTVIPTCSGMGRYSRYASPATTGSSNKLRSAAIAMHAMSMADRSTRIIPAIISNRCRGGWKNVCSGSICKPLSTELVSLAVTRRAKRWVCAGLSNGRHGGYHRPPNPA
jgi:hypothetical protein